MGGCRMSLYVERDDVAAVVKARTTHFYSLVLVLTWTLTAV